MDENRRTIYTKSTILYSISKQPLNPNLTNFLILISKIVSINTYKQGLHVVTTLTQFGLTIQVQN